jgi:hypothetical protein
VTGDVIAAGDQGRRPRDGSASARAGTPPRAWRALRSHGSPGAAHEVEPVGRCRTQIADRTAVTGFFEQFAQIAAAAAQTPNIGLWCKVAASGLSPLPATALNLQGRKAGDRCRHPSRPLASQTARAASNRSYAKARASPPWRITSTPPRWGRARRERYGFWPGRTRTRQPSCGWPRKPSLLSRGDALALTAVAVDRGQVGRSSGDALRRVGGLESAHA